LASKGIWFRYGTEVRDQFAGFCAELSEIALADEMHPAESMDILRRIWEMAGPSAGLAMAVRRWYGNFARVLAILAARVIRAAAWLAIFCLVLSANGRAEL
jgi:hypothetical protein